MTFCDIRDLLDPTETQLQLALEWKRIDIAKKYILFDTKWPVKMNMIFFSF